MEPKPTSGTWFGDAKALLEMGAPSIDAATVRGLIREFEDLEVALWNAEYLLQYGSPRSPSGGSIMSDVVQKIREEYERFLAALPSLLPDHRDKWVVFKDGEIASEHDTEEQAYQSAILHFGTHGGYVIAQVKEVVPIPVTAGVLFGIP